VRYASLRCSNILVPIREITTVRRLILAAGAICLINLSAPAAAESPQDFVGRWIGKNYGCSVSHGRTAARDQIVEIAYRDNKLIATKIDGDECVTAGKASWWFDVPKHIELNKRYSVTFQIGTYLKPNSGTVAGMVRFVSRDKIESLNGSAFPEITFLRVQD
jgi:hypothetical protein